LLVLVLPAHRYTSSHPSGMSALVAVWMVVPGVAVAPTRMGAPLVAALRVIAVKFCATWGLLS
jgi:hypothetical protein